MSRHAVLAALLACCLLPVAGAHADPPVAAGWSCGLSSTGTAGMQSGQLAGGPVSAADSPVADPGGNPASVTVRCAVVVGSSGHYDDPPVASGSVSGVGSATLAPKPVVFPVGAADNVYVCTTWVLRDAHGDEETGYLDDATDEFFDEPSWATCALATLVSGGGTDGYVVTQRYVDTR
jgi:hypothetical protein